MPPRRDLHEENRLAWDAATRAHNSHKGDQARFLREGGSTLFPEELDLLGDVRGSSLVHLQCNSGQDTLCLARLGAVVTGVDISDEAIAFAGRLSIDAGIPAEFARADVYDWLDAAAATGTRYDVAFSSYGALCWLSDLDAWARAVAAILRPGGRLVAIDFHPLAMMFDPQLSLAYPYASGGEPIATDGIGDYVAEAGEALVPWGFEEGTVDFRNPHRSNEFAWGLADIVSAVLSSGLRLNVFREYPFSNGAKLYDRMRTAPGRRLLLPDDIPAFPLMYGLSASRPA